MEKPLPRSTRSLYPLIGFIVAAFLFSYLWTSLIVPAAMKYIDDPIWQPLLLNIAYALLMGGLAILAMRMDWVKIENLGIGAVQVLEATWIVVIGWAALFAIFIPLSINGFGLINWDPLQIFGQWFFASMAEELFFRGYLQNRLATSLINFKKPLNIVFSIIITNILFATIRLPSLIAAFIQSKGSIDVYHLVISITVYFFVGVALSYCYYRTRNLILVGILHGGWITQVADSSYREVIYLITFIVVIEGYLAIKQLQNKKSQNLQKIKKDTRGKRSEL